MLSMPDYKYASDKGLPSRDIPRARLFSPPRSHSLMTWADLFARADRYDRTETDVIDALRRRRAGDDDD